MTIFTHVGANAFIYTDFAKHYPLHSGTDYSDDIRGVLGNTFMALISVQPQVVDHAYMPHMKAMYVPFHMGYSSLICYQRLQSDRPIC